MSALEELGRKYLLSIALMAPGRQVARLMGKISAANHYGHMIPECWWKALKDMAEPRRYKKFKKRFARKKKPRAAAVRVLPKVTRTVTYEYKASDDRRLTDFYASPEWKLMRYEALRLHAARCQCCGADPSDGKTILNVDHIKPARVFWNLRLEIGNLQVLCGPCNQGKGARHADDWRPKRDMAMFDMDSIDRI